MFRLLGTPESNHSDTHRSTGAFDGANMWVASDQTNTVVQLRVSDGALLGTIGVGNFPFAVAFDGANVWVTNK